MPTNKDFKRLVRGRMQKTGEAYTTARAHLLNAKTPVAYAKLAGMSDAAIKKATEKFQIPDWWVQMMTVGYERIKGLRAVGQRRDEPRWKKC